MRRKVQYSTLQCSTVHYSAKQITTVQGRGDSRVQCSAVQYITVHEIGVR